MKITDGKTNLARAVAAYSALLTGSVVGMPAAYAIDVGTEAELRDAIFGGESSINLTADITLTQDLPMITADVTIYGDAHVLSGGSAHRAFFVQSGTVTIENVAINDTLAKGGDGGDSARGGDNGAGGGGGGLGAGGAIFVNEGATVTVRDVNIGDAEAQGGAGGDGIDVIVDDASGGGGGGLGGNGGDANFDGGDGGAGGGGYSGDGGDVASLSGTYSGGGGGGAFGDGESSPGADGGAGGGRQLDGAGGAGGDYNATDDGADGGALGEGGGGGSKIGDGGDGAIGGGGGGGGYRGGNGGDYGGGGGGAPFNAGSGDERSSGGSGGFGGGGGGTTAYARSTFVAPGGDGGFGGGGGGGAAAGAGGMFAGDGGVGGSTTVTPGGGGGAGLGGAVFVRDGGTLIIEDTDFSGVYATTGGQGGVGVQGGTDGGDGQALGDVFFVMDNTDTTISVAGGDTLTFGGAGAIAGSGSLSKSGTGTLEISQANAGFSGDWSIDEGTLSISTAGALGTGTVSIGADGTLDLNDIDMTLGGLGGAGDFNLGSAELTVGSNNASTTFSGALSGTGGLIKQGSGSLTLTGSNTYTGGTTVSAGTLIGDSDALQGDIANDAAVVFDQAADGTYGGDMSGSGTLTKKGDGNLTLAGANTHSGGTNLMAGTLTVGSDNALGSGALTISAGATLAISGDDRTIANDVVVQGDFTLLPESGSDLTLRGDLDLGGAVRTLRHNGSFGTVNLNGPIDNGGLDLQTDLSGFNVAFFDMEGFEENTYTGETRVGDLVSLTLNKNMNTTAIAGDLVIENNGVVTVAANQQIADTAGITIEGSGRLNVGFLNDAFERVASLSGDGGVTLNGDSALIVDTGDFEGSIDGDGWLVKQGGGSLTLTGSNTYTGGTTVSAGTLIGNSDALQDDITNDAAVVFDQAADGTYGGDMSGSGTLTKRGAGMLYLTGDNTYSGATLVNGGGLAVNGSLASAITVGSGALLQGIGNTAAVTLLSGAVHAPGNSIGTQTVNGAYILDAGSALEIEVDADGNADRVVVNGGVELGGATLRVIGLPGPYSAERFEHVIIANDDSDAVVGVFDTLDNRLAFYEAALDYAGNDGNDVLLTLDRNQIDFVDIAQTPNQKAVAGTIAGLPGSDGDAIRTALLGLTTSVLPVAYDQLSGDIHGGTPRVDILLNQQMGEQVIGRLSSLRAARNLGSARLGTSLAPQQIAGFVPVGPITASGMPLQGEALPSSVASVSNAAYQRGLWVQAMGGAGSLEGDGNAAATDYDWRGAMAGYDIAVSSRLNLGVFFGYLDGETEQRERDARVDTDNLTTGIYGDYRLGDWRVAGQLGWTRVAAESARDLDFASIERTAKADYTDHVVSARAEISRGIELRHNLWVEPYVGLGAIRQSLGDFTEEGAGTANLTRDSESELTGTGTLGVRIAGSWELGNGWRILPQAHLGWEHRLGSTDNSVDLALVGGDPFTVSGTSTERDTLIGNLGISVLNDDGWRAYADYRPTISGNRREHGFVAGVALRW